MNIEKRLMLLVGSGMCLILLVTVLSLQYITASFSRTSRQISAISEESRRIWFVERHIEHLSRSVQQYVLTGDKGYMNAYEQVRKDLDGALASFPPDGENRETIARLKNDADRLKTKAERIFGLQSPAAGQRMVAVNLLSEMNALQQYIRRDIGRQQDENTDDMNAVLDQLRSNNLRVDLVFLLVLVTSLASLIVFVLYFHRKVSMPLTDLWEGTEEISRGNLDYRVNVEGAGDIARLGERFNEMTQKLKVSYADLEQKLYERTHELASLDAVALTLSQAGSLKDVLDKSLLRILDSLSGIEAKGGVFLCEPGGEILRLTSHKGLPAEFVQRESEIRMGECLCGIVAQTGEMLYSEGRCDDQRHSRIAGNKDHGHIIIPIKSRGIVLGVIFLYPEKDFELKPSDVKMLDAIGAQLGMAVENFRFYAEVKESSEKYWDLFENARDILFTMDAGGRLTAVNKAAEVFSGYNKVELMGKRIFDFLTPAGIETVRKMVAADFKGRQWTEFESRKRKGTKAFIEVSVRKLMGKNQPVGYQVSARDVTEQKQLREVLVQAERLGAIGQVVVTVRHEINNPLTTVIGNTELLLERYEGRDPELTARLETILNNALRIAKIVKQLQGIRKDKVVEYLKGVPMTDLQQSDGISGAKKR